MNFRTRFSQGENHTKLGHKVLENIEQDPGSEICVNVLMALQNITDIVDLIRGHLHRESVGNVFIGARHPLRHPVKPHGSLNDDGHPSRTESPHHKTRLCCFAEYSICRARCTRDDT